MSSFKKNLELGAILLTESGEYYCYIGYYVGTPRSFYSNPEQGYLYLFIGRNYSPNLNFWVKDNLIRFKDHGIDGNACYTKNPKQFRQIVGYANVLNEEYLRSIYPFGLCYIKEK